MAFLLYKRECENGKAFLSPTGRHFSLAGRQLIYQVWQKRGSKLNEGWEVGANELIQMVTDESQSDETFRLVIDFHPTANWRIGLVELRHVYAYTFSTDNGVPAWTPLMLKLRDVFYYDDKPFTPEEKVNLTQKIEEKLEPKPTESIEFLYLNGETASWNWGISGRTNAVFLQEGARDYFRPFF